MGLGKAPATRDEDTSAAPRLHRIRADRQGDLGGGGHPRQEEAAVRGDSRTLRQRGARRRRRGRQEGGRGDQGVPREAQGQEDNHLSLRPPELEPRAAQGGSRGPEDHGEAGQGSRARDVPSPLRLEQGVPDQGQGPSARRAVAGVLQRRSRCEAGGGSRPREEAAARAYRGPALRPDKEERLRRAPGDGPQDNRREARPLQLPGAFARDGLLAQQGPEAEEPPHRVHARGAGEGRATSRSALPPCSATPSGRSAATGGTTSRTCSSPTWAARSSLSSP